MHMVSFQAAQNIERVVNHEGVEKSMLTEYFEANRLHEDARSILYRDFPEWYTWQKRIVSAHPAEGERYYLRVLLNHVTGATSYEDLRTVNGEILPTFREAAERRGLIEGDNTLDESLTESTLYEMPSSLRWLFATILSMGKEIESFPLPDIQEEYDTSIGVTREIFEESTIELNVEDTYLSDSLNSDQRAAYDEIMSAIDRDEGGVFFVDGPGGTGKTFLYRALLAMVRGQKKIAIATATSSVAASIMPGGRTQIINSSLRRSYLWDSMRHLKLVRNMRAHSDPWFAEYLLRIGDGKEVTNRDGEVRLPDEICVSRTGKDTDLDTLIDNTFPSLDANTSGPDYITSRAILSTRNDSVDRINLKMISRFQGDEMVYHSFDCAVDDPHNYYPPEFLNTLTPNGLPPHVLKLKINCPVILLRNIDPANGLCNGTRLVVRGFQRNVIDAEIVLGQHAGKRIFLPRIPLCPSDDEMFPFQFKRKQFPIRLSFAMTVNKAQGQTIPNVSIYLPEPVFSHGQLYVALSRSTARKNVKILAVPDAGNKKRNSNDSKKKSSTCSKNESCDYLVGTYTKNIVYKEILTS
uniref:ATP-dependent DNA helicase n=1 Tax=Aegilops tauschii subsp. strangulata TaxID=200361 RepID=A0A453JUW8_AEGTS